MIARMRILLAALLVLSLAPCAAFAQCAPAPDSSYFFRNLSQQRAAAKIAGDRKVFEAQLSETFTSHDAAGHVLSRQEFIDAQLSDHHATANRSFAISDYTLTEHVKGHTVATYRLREGTRELQVTEVYEVVERQWRLATVEIAPVEMAQPVVPAMQLTSANR